MKKLYYIILIVFLVASHSFSQNAEDYNGYLDSVVVVQNAENYSLHWALDTRASDGYDGPFTQTGVFEIEGPPAPPGGLYGVFTIPNYSTGVIPDVRNYDSFPYTGEHMLTMTLANLVPGIELKLHIDLPAGIEAHVQDQVGGILIDSTISGRDSLELNIALTTYNFKLIFTNFDPNNIVGIENESIPSKMKLSQNYPNPFNPSTTINFSLNARSDISLKIFDILGNEIATLADGIYEAGNHNLNFNVSHLSSGVYIYQLKTNNGIISKKMTLLK